MENTKSLHRGLIFCGDIHGEWREFVFNATQRYKFTCADIIVLGDFGIGFDNSFSFEYKKFEKRLEKNDLTIWVLRGNHDDPSYFQDMEKFSYPRVKFMEDHKVYDFSGRSLYTIGGASSTDIIWRLKKNYELAASGKDRKVWWPEEVIVEKKEDLPEKVDIIISHSGPLAFHPVITRYPETPLEQYDKILRERKYLDYILENIKTKYWFYGHFHSYYSGTYGKIQYRCLGIMDFYECPEIENDNPQGEIKKDKQDE